MKKNTLIPIEASTEQGLRHRIDISPLDVFIRMLGILFARCMPIAYLAPIGLSFLTLDKKFSLKSLINLFFVSLGYVLLLDINLAVRYISACIIFELVLFVMEYNAKISLYFIAAAASLILFICDIFVLWWTGFSIAEFILVLCDIAILLMGIVVFDRTDELFSEKKILSRSLLFDEKICICVLCAIILTSTKSVNILSVFNISNFLGFAIVLVTAISCRNCMTSSVCAVFVGASLGLGGDFSETVTIYVLCGLLCGCASYFGKIAASLALVLCTAVFTLYMGFDTITHTPNFYEAIVAAVTAYFIPKNVLSYIEKSLEGTDKNNFSVDEFKKSASDRLMKISDSFFNLSEIFSEISDRESHVDMSDISLMFDTAADRICKNCKNVKLCWKKDFNSTYTTMFKFLEIMERRGRITPDDMPEFFSNRCIHLIPLITEINRLFEVYKINRVWKTKLSENRQLTAEQFMGISEIIRDAAEDINAKKIYDSVAADEILAELQNINIFANQIEVYRDTNEVYTAKISIDKKTTVDTQNDLLKKVRDVVKKVLGINMSAVKHTQSDNHIYYELTKSDSFETTVGFANKSHKDECGDKHYFSHISGGKFVITLSDGMGTGHEAAVQSETIVRLLSSFLEAGFDKEIAVKLVNSVMVMKSAHDVFATVDLCIIDLYTGEVEFIKNGAEASYIKHKNHTETVRAASLPLGIISMVDIETFARTLDNNSYIIMTSDGVIGKDGDDSWLRELIDAIDIELSPSDFSSLILEEAIRRHNSENAENNVSSDDMTVLCVKLKDCRGRKQRQMDKTKIPAAS